MKNPIFASITAAAFLLSSLGSLQAQELNALSLPKPGNMIQLSPAYAPAILKGIKVHPDNPMRFDFVLDPGGQKNVGKQEATQLIKYFLASLTVPEKDLWVNLSPYEKDRIIPEGFGQTQMGRDLLAEDYMLKQLTSSLLYPEGELGKKFWKKIYLEVTKQQKGAGPFNAFWALSPSISTFNKVWIVPEKAVVYENPKNNTAYVVESKLKVLTEEDYLALNKNMSSPNISAKQSPQGIVGDRGHSSELDARQKSSGMTGEIIREVLIPSLTKEVNEGAQFSQLRQIYHSFILAAWYKKKIKDSILSKAFVDRNKIKGVNINDPDEKLKIYQRYLEAFKKGAYNYIKEEKDTVTGQMIPRKYFSGGVELSDKAMVETHKLPAALPDGVELSVSFPPKKPDGLGRFEQYSSKGSRNYQEDGVVDVTIDLDAALEEQKDKLNAKGIDKNVIISAVGVSKMRVIAVMDSHSNGDQKGEDLINRIKSQLAPFIITSLIERKGDVNQSIKTTYSRFITLERTSKAATTLSMIWITDKIHWGVFGDSPLMILKKDGSVFQAPVHALADLNGDLFKKINTEVERRNMKDHAWMVTTMGVFYWPDRMKETIDKISALRLNGEEIMINLATAKLIDAKGYIRGRGAKDMEQSIRNLETIEDSIRKMDHSYGERILEILRTNRRVSLGVPAVIGARDFFGLMAKEPYTGEEELANISSIGLGSDGVLASDVRSLDYIVTMMQQNRRAADIVDQALHKNAHVPGGADNITWAIWHPDAAMNASAAIAREDHDVNRIGVEAAFLSTEAMADVLLFLHSIYLSPQPFRSAHVSKVLEVIRNKNNVKVLKDKKELMTFISFLISNFWTNIIGDIEPSFLDEFIFQIEKYVQYQLISLNEHDREQYLKDVDEVFNSVVREFNTMSHGRQDKAYFLLKSDVYPYSLRALNLYWAEDRVAENSSVVYFVRNVDQRQGTYYLMGQAAGYSNFAFVVRDSIERYIRDALMPRLPGLSGGIDFDGKVGKFDGAVFKQISDEGFRLIGLIPGSFTFLNFNKEAWRIQLRPQVVPDTTKVILAQTDIDRLLEQSQAFLIKGFDVFEKAGKHHVEDSLHATIEQWVKDHELEHKRRIQSNQITADRNLEEAFAELASMKHMGINPWFLLSHFVDLVIDGRAYGLDMLKRASGKDSVQGIIAWIDDTLLHMDVEQIIKMFDRVYWDLRKEHGDNPDKAAVANNPGGIDLNANKDALQVKSSSTAGGINFNTDAIMLKAIENAPGLDIKILDMKPLGDLKQFLGAP